MKISVLRESYLIEGHVLDCARAPLLAALRRYDPQLYILWNPKKRGGLGVWELRRKPEVKKVRPTIVSDHSGIPNRQGDIYDMGDYTIVVPKYHETAMENHVKDFEYLNYGMVQWVADHDAWKYGYRGKDLMKEVEYREAKWMEKIDEDSANERDYALKQHRTMINDFRQYILSGGNPYRLADHWGRE